ncbi:MAG: universal stress protein [Actinomycetota bacterium]|nr:universal stress protein [Actinomycetota bacterium]
MYDRIAVGTDLSKTARVATERASGLARRLGAELFLVHAGRDPGDELTQLASELGGEAVVAQGSPAEVLLSETERLKADLLVVGSVGMSGARRFLLGSVPNKISHHAGTDLLIVKTDSAPESVSDYSKVLVGTDGSPTAMRAVTAASRLAKCLDAHELIVCAHEPLSEGEREQLAADPNDPVAQWGAGGSAKGTPDEFRWRISGAAQAEDVLERAAERALKEGVEAEVRAPEGHPAEVLCSIAKDEGFDVIVVGSVGMTGARRFMLGNVPHRVSHSAPTDVLILRTQS